MPDETKNLSVQTHKSTVPPSGVYSRARLEEAAQLEIARFERYGHPVSLIIGEIDHFESIQESVGQAAGERLLQELCDLAKKCARTTDLLGHWGNKQLVFLLPNSGLMSSRILTERVRNTLLKQEFAGIEKLTMSFGAASCIARESWDSWLKRANNALAMAKAEGRNRVVLAFEERQQESPQHQNTGLVQITWRTAYESGNAAIDAEHKFLFDAANSVLGAIFTKQSKEEISVLMHSLVAEIMQHFYHEEEILRAAGYAEADNHHLLHKQLATRAKQLVDDYDSDNLDLGVMFQFITYEVIAQHILAEDRKFFPCFAR